MAEFLDMPYELDKLSVTILRPQHGWQKSEIILTHSIGSIFTFFLAVISRRIYNWSLRKSVALASIVLWVHLISISEIVTDLFYANLYMRELGLAMAWMDNSYLARIVYIILALSSVLGLILISKTLVKPFLSLAATRRVRERKNALFYLRAITLVPYLIISVVFLFDPYFYQTYNLIQWFFIGISVLLIQNRIPLNREVKIYKVATLSEWSWSRFSFLAGFISLLHLIKSFYL
ncbi:hypothetical protein [Sediminitomix flava]|nr:hypothetical protein [Sediminitomix flava]